MATDFTGRGDSLRDRLAGLSAERRDLMEKLLKSRKPGETASSAIQPRHRAGPVPLSFAQQRMWFLSQLTGGDPIYNIDLARRFMFPLDFDALERALNAIVRRHEPLRTTFAIHDGQPMQVVAPEMSVPLVRIDLSDLPPMRREAEAPRRATEEARKPFDLARGPLVRTTLLRMAENDHILLLTLHHIVCDAWSMMVLANELIAVYMAFIAGKPSPLPDLPIQYADYAVWQREWLQGSVLETQLAYWKERLADLPLLRLPTDRPRPPVQTFRGATWMTTLPADLIRDTRAFCQREGVTLFMTFLAAAQILAHRYTGQDDVVLGAPVANRNRPETQGLIGVFVNTLVMRTDLSGNPTVRELLNRVRSTVSEAFAHQDLPFETLVEALQPERDMSRNPLYQVAVQVYQHSTNELQGSRALQDRVKVDKGTASIDLAFDVFDIPTGLMVRVEYSTDLFDHSTVERMMGHIQTILAGMVANPDARISELPILNDAERRLLLVTWNATEADYPRNKCLHELFEAQARRRPERVAVVSGEGSLTYGELDQRADRLACHLQSRGVGADVLVALCVERCLDMVVGILAILKSGGAYVPLDPAYPKDRLAQLLEEAGRPILLTHERLLERVPDGPRFCLDADWPGIAPPPDAKPRREAHAGSLAYVIYTSGSTGRPNGVMIEHRAVSNQLSWMQRAFPLGPDDRTLQKYSISFDASVLEIFCPLMVGGQVVLAGREQVPDPARLTRLIRANHVTVLDLVPSLLEALLDDRGFRECRSLRRVICGGEPMPPELPGKLLAQLGVELVNMYGPTETTINATSWTYDADSANQRVPIGRPCANTRIYILDRYGDPAPVGVPGEICIAGDGLARGYLNRPELTAARFAADPFTSVPGARMFRTGDLGRFLPGGDIEFLGRADGQVKVNGFRVETGEVQAVLASHEAVRFAHVEACEAEDGQRRMVAYVVPKPDRPVIWPSIGEHFGYDELMYHAMTHDEARNRAYRLAIAGAVRGKTVVDIGTGADAIWARLCVREGAKRVYAIETLREAHDNAARLISRLGLEDRITLLHGDSMTISLPEPVDVCVSELIGTIGSSEGAVPILNNARRFLKPGGVMIPVRCTTKVATVSLPAEIRERPCFTDLTGGYADRILASVGHPFDIRVCLKNLPDTAVTSDPCDFETLDFRRAAPAAQSNAVRLTIGRDCLLDGFLLWINLYTAPGVLIDVMRGEHSWLPVFFPVFYPGVEARTGDRIEAESFVLDNGTITPDYRIRGCIVHGSGRETRFDYTSFHHGRPQEPNPFYEALFSTPRQPDASEASAATRNLAAELRNRVRQRLPSYMVPSSFVMLKALPVTPAGKIDARALPPPEAAREETASEFINPRTELEWIVARAWQELLHIPKVGIHDNFFDLGGHSLLIIRLQNRLREQLDVDVSLTDLFQYPTVSALAEALAKAGAGRPASSSNASVSTVG